MDRIHLTNMGSFVFINLLFLCVILQVKNTTAQYQQELALKMAQCQVIMTFSEQCSDEYCNRKCGGLCTITPSTNIPVCVCFPGQKKTDISNCAITTTISTDNTLTAQTMICQANCNEVVTTINPKIFAFAGLCQDVEMGEKPARYCVCVSHHIGHFVTFRGILAGDALSKVAAAAINSQVSASDAIAAGSVEELSVRAGKVLPDLSTDIKSSSISTSMHKTNTSHKSEIQGTLNNTSLIELMKPEIEKYSNSTGFTRPRRVSKAVIEISSGVKNRVLLKLNISNSSILIFIAMVSFLNLHF